MAGDLFVDSTFASFTPRKRLRLPDIYPVPDTFISPSASADDVAQGVHPDCFFIAAVMALAAARPQLVLDLFLTTAPQPTGRYEVRFYREFTWHTVVVDDSIAVDDGGRPLYCRSPTQQWWPLILEKAYAKFYGGYDAIGGGSCNEALHDLTGLPVENVPFSNATNSKGESVGSPFWAVVDGWLKAKNAVVTLGTPATFPKKVGLQPNHAYTVTGVCAKAALVTVRNPTRHGTPYTGPMHHSDRRWTPLLRAATATVADREDVFAVPIDLVVALFQGIRVGMLGVRLLKRQTVRGEWVGRSMGGCTSFSTWRHNPMYRISNRSGDTDRVFLMLGQPEQRGTTAAISYYPCGVNVVRVPAPGAEQPPDYSGVAHPPVTAITPFLCARQFFELRKPRYWNQREVSTSVMLPPGEWLIVPNTYDPGKATPFHLSLWSASGMTSFVGDGPLDFDASLSPAAGRQLPKSFAGGACAVKVTLAAKQTVHVMLQHTPPGGPRDTSIGVRYFRLFLTRDDTGATVAAVPTAVNYTTLALATTAPVSGPYTVTATEIAPKGRPVETPATLHVRVSTVSGAAAPVPVLDQSEAVVPDTKAPKASGRPLSTTALPPVRGTPKAPLSVAPKAPPAKAPAKAPVKPPAKEPAKATPVLPRAPAVKAATKAVPPLGKRCTTTVTTTRRGPSGVKVVKVTATGPSMAGAQQGVRALLQEISASGGSAAPRGVKR